MESPVLAKIKRQLKTIALLDAIISPEWDYRYFSYNSKWGSNEEMGSYRNGSGEEWFFWTDGSLAGYKSFSPHEKLRIKDFSKILATSPSIYKPFLTEPAFSMDMATSIWYLENQEWKKYGQPSEYIIELDEILAWTAKEYHEWASGYYEREIPLESVEAIFRGNILQSHITNLNDGVDGGLLQSDRLEIGL